MKKLCFYGIISIVVFLYGSTVLLSTEIDVPAGSNMITTALLGAQQGDVLILSTNGGEYLESSDVIIDFDVTIKASDGLADRPIWKTQGNYNIILITNLIVKGIIFDGEMKAKSAIVNSEFALPNVLKVDQCEFRNFAEQAIRKEVDESGAYDSVFVSNSLFHHCERGIDLAGDDSNLDYPGSRYLYVKNTTVYDMPETGIKNEAYIGPGEDSVIVHIDHVTVHNCGYEALYFKMVSAKSVVTNSILVNCVLRGLYINYAPPNLMATYCDVWNNKETNYKGKNGGGASAGVGSFEEDPMFVDPENGDFTLQEGSPCIGTASDGSNMGDLNWGGISAVEQKNTTPSDFALIQNYPNPFNPITTIGYHLPKSELVRLSVYNSMGQKVATLSDDMKDAGIHKVQWNGLSDQGYPVPSGIYLCRICAGKFSRTVKMILFK